MSAAVEDRATLALAATLVREARRAWLLRIGGRRVWLPKADCELDFQGAGADLFGRTGAVTVRLPRWLADREGLGQ